VIAVHGGKFCCANAQEPARTMKVLLSDWMDIPIQPYPVTLDRLKFLLVDQLR
jgi:hypothetical protein